LKWLDVSLEWLAEEQLSELLSTCLNRSREWGSTFAEYREDGNEGNDELAEGGHFFQTS